MVAQVLKSSGGFVWVRENYDGGAVGHPRAGLRLPRNDDPRAHHTRRPHGRERSCEYQKGRANPFASISVWMQGLLHRANLDRNEQRKVFVGALERACVEVIDVDGVMTKDLALAIYGKNGMRREHWVVMDAYMNAVKVRCFGSFSFRFVSFRSVCLSADGGVMIRHRRSWTSCCWLLLKRRSTVARSIYIGYYMIYCMDLLFFFLHNSLLGSLN